MLILIVLLIKKKAQKRLDNNDASWNRQPVNYDVNAFKYYNLTLLT